MKKIRTVAAKKIEKNASQELTIGLDLGDRSSWYCVLDERGEVVHLESGRRLVTDSSGLLVDSRQREKWGLADNSGVAHHPETCNGGSCAFSLKSGRGE